jgi:hypothetical protein
MGRFESAKEHTQYLAEYCQRCRYFSACPILSLHLIFLDTVDDNLQHCMDLFIPVSDKRENLRCVFIDEESKKCTTKKEIKK